MDVYSWDQIESKFTESIILGNGASIAIDPRFSYKSLFDNATVNGLITENLAKIFAHLSTQDYELVLRMLWHAYHINVALNVGDSETLSAYKDLRTALIRGVRDVHIDYSDVKNQLITIATFLSRFSTVASLNYDFLVYWAMLAANSAWKQHWFKDCFIRGEFEEDWEWLRESHGAAEGSTLVFYPHGNLALAADIFGSETKITTHNDDALLETVVEKWQSDLYSPLFVSEGTKDQKIHAINRSAYLKNIYENALSNLGERIVIFGWSLSEQDDHILKAILENKNLKSLAISVVVGNDTAEKCDSIKNKIKKVSGNKIQIVFFDAKSSGCWINP